MKSKIFISVLTSILIAYSFQLTAQKSSKLTPEQLSFADLANPFAGLNVNVSGINIQNNFNSTNINDNSVSAGTDLFRSKIDATGFTMQNFAAFPSSLSNLDLKELTFQTTGAGVIGLDQGTWTFGITDVGVFDNTDAVQSALRLNYTRITDDIALIYPLLFVNPDDGNMGMGTFDEVFNAQLYVEEFGQDQVAISANNTSATAATKWGVYSISQGGGSGIRYGVVGQAFTSTGAKYGVFGTSSSTDGGYAVYASGNLAYTGTITDVSDRKFKKNIKVFSALDRVMQLQPKTYEMKRDEFKRMNLATGSRYGFIAQELQEIFPDLVREQIHSEPYQDGDSLNVEQIEYLGVEYMAMIPILTKAMQEQQEQIEEEDNRLSKLERQNQLLQRENRELEERLNQLETLVQQLSQQTSGDSNTNSAIVSDARLDQNQPNPFNQNTSIPYFIPSTVQSAILNITDAQGRVLKSIPIADRGQGKTILETDLLSGGVYFYSLTLDGKVVDTKKMIAVK